MAVTDDIPANESAGDQIEFIGDVVVPGSVDAASVSAGGSGSWDVRWVGVLALLAACVWFVTSTGSDRSEDEPFPPDSPAEALSPEPDAPDPDASAEVDVAPPVEPPVFGQWPNPPTDRDPYVVRIPGPVERPVDLQSGRLDRTTLVYVNTAGDPTVVSFDSGDVFEVDVAAIRVHETFAVEDGRVVSLEGVNPALDDATEAAIVFHTYRDVDEPGVGTMGDMRGARRGPELCLSDATCARAGLGLERLTRPGLVVERFDPTSHWAVADLLDAWELQDRWLVAADGYRIPEPVSVIWVISPPSGGASSSNGLI